MTQVAPQVAPSAAEIESLAEAALDKIPEPFRAEALGVGLIIDEFASDDVLDEFGLESPFELTGMYQGTPLTERSFAAQDTQPALIWLFRRAILEEWLERGDIDLGDLVAHIVVHELAHHFGWSDEDIATIDKWWE